MSSPIQPFGMASLETSCVEAEASNLSPATESTGRCKETPFALAFSIRDFARSSLSSSTNEFPTAPPIALKKV